MQTTHACTDKQTGHVNLRHTTPNVRGEAGDETVKLLHTAFE